MQIEETKVDSPEVISIDCHEFDCPLCLQLLYEPLTLECGHSFCRDCLGQALQLKRHCPLCRRRCSIDAMDSPTNKLITNILETYLHSGYEQRSKEIKTVKKMRKHRHPLFIGSSPEFPHCTISLRIFETKYRVMVNRILNSDSKFIMTMTSHHHEVSQTPRSIATLCKIQNCQSFIDGRSQLQVIGLKRVQLSNIKPEPDSFGLLSAEIEDYIDIEPKDETPNISGDDGGITSDNKSSEFRDDKEEEDGKRKEEGEELDSVPMVTMERIVRTQHSVNSTNTGYAEDDGFWNFIAKLKVNIDENLKFQRREWLNNNTVKSDDNGSPQSSSNELSDTELREEMMDIVDLLAFQKRNGGHREAFYKIAGRPPKEDGQFAFWIAGTVPRCTYRSMSSHVEVSQIQLQILESTNASERLRLAHCLAKLCIQSTEKRSKLQFWIIVGIIGMAVLYELFNGS